MSCWKLPWPALSTSSTGETKYLFSLISNGTLAWFVCRHLEIIKPPLDVLLQEITQVKTKTDQQWIIFHKSGSSYLQPEASSGFPEKYFRVRSKRDGGDEGGVVIAWQRWGPGTALSHQVTHSLLWIQWHDIVMAWIAYFFKRNDIFTQSRFFRIILCRLWRDRCRDQNGQGISQYVIHMY